MISFVFDWLIWPNIDDWLTDSSTGLLICHTLLCLEIHTAKSAATDVGSGRQANRSTTSRTQVSKESPALMYPSSAGIRTGY